MADFAKETDLCAAFLSTVPDDWTAYPETGGFDILLVRNDDGFQIGIEAKLTLNAKVICQAVEEGRWYTVEEENPDCRAVLVPDGKQGNPLHKLCSLLGVTVIHVMEDSSWKGPGWRIHPTLPTERYHDVFASWIELAPTKRVRLPEFIPDVIAGDSGPVKLTFWKQKAIRIAITLEKRGYLTRADFKHFSIDMQRWRNGWIVLGADKNWVAGPKMPDFRAQHPVNYAQFEATYDAWRIDRVIAA